jgi:hypothetical protein
MTSEGYFDYTIGLIPHMHYDGACGTAALRGNQEAPLKTLQDVQLYYREQINVERHIDRIALPHGDGSLNNSVAYFDCCKDSTF